MEAVAPLSYSTPPRRDRRRRAEWLAWVALLPVAGWLAVLVVLPTVMLVVVSLCETDPDLGVPVPHVTLDHYRDVFQPEVRPTLWRAGLAGLAVAVVAGTTIRRAWAVRWGALLGGAIAMHVGVGRLGDGIGTDVRTFWRSVEMAGLATLLCLLIGYPVAFVVGRAKRPWRDRLLLAVMIPFWTSFLIRTYAWKTILSQTGLLNATLRTAHLAVLIPASGGLLYTPTAVVLGLVYAYLPFMILPIYGSVERLDPSLVEASQDLGAGPVRTLLSVIVPLTAPGISAGVLLVFVPAVGMYAVSSLLGGNQKEMIGDTISNYYGPANDQPAGAALGVILLAAFGLVVLATGVRRREGK